MWLRLFFVSHWSYSAANPRAENFNHRNDPQRCSQTLDHYDK
jgi:hypothetical protein